LQCRVALLKLQSILGPRKPGEKSKLHRACRTCEIDLFA
jgi:hypothetical protein